MHSILVQKPGLYTTVQDLGRKGLQEFGVPVSGPMDEAAHKLANRIIGNDPNDALLEMTSMGPELLFTAPTAITITGADLSAQLNGNPLPMNQRLPVKAEDTLSFGRLRSGFRAYLAVSGGLLTEKLMGSRSVCERIGLLRPLKTGDHILIPPPTDAGEVIIPNEIPSYHNPAVLRIHPGPEINQFSTKDLNTLLTSTYTLSPSSNRMGARLVGPPIRRNTDQQQLSGGITLGTIQIPPDGQPIIMMADRQPTGGYPRIGYILHKDLSQLAQLPIGGKLNFKDGTQP